MLCQKLSNRKIYQVKVMKIEKRGRPSHSSSDPSNRPTKYSCEYKKYTGRSAIWTYDLSKNPHGPISVEQFYPAGSEEVVEDLTSDEIPKTKRKYVNPNNGKLVAYTRYVQIMKKLGF
jgi:hypothetical protein